MGHCLSQLLPLPFAIRATLKSPIEQVHTCTFHSFHFFLFVPMVYPCSTSCMTVFFVQIVLCYF
ncbi:hypothetical protein HanOQP8_Chr09g0309551 [Helianthus annuus]|nr:hypothetical protein HanIR_Chr09g0397781 [Helianthus annuus]KAJ0540985.1 hypothetical protein HanHA89_Chr09g0323271 [Helianthus annuus]KAJ0710196.1 hypothetical protein HanOQP8_Chr09g0309551 [Helianthus annuus]